MFFSREWKINLTPEWADEAALKAAMHYRLGWNFRMSQHNWQRGGEEEDEAMNGKEAYTEAIPGMLFKPIFCQFCYPEWFPLSHPIVYLLMSAWCSLACIYWCLGVWALPQAGSANRPWNRGPSESMCRSSSKTPGKVVLIKQTWADTHAGLQLAYGQWRRCGGWVLYQLRILNAGLTLGWAKCWLLIIKHISISYSTLSEMLWIERIYLYHVM